MPTEVIDDSVVLGGRAERTGSRPASNTYRNIFKATTFMGGAQAATILFGVLRNKILAVWFGPSGVGLVGLYGSVTTLVGTITGLGIPMGGVRQIADALGKNDHRRVGVTVLTLKTVTWISGLLGMCAIMVFASPIARLTFSETTDSPLHLAHVWGLRLVAVVVLLEGIGAKQKAVLQGMRRIKEIGACQVLGAVGGTAAALPFLLLFGQQGIVAFLVVASACAVLASWWFARQLPVEHVTVTRREFATEIRILLNVGVAMVVTGFIGAAVNYLARLLVGRQLGLQAVGWYQAALTLSTTYVGLVLSAMGTDFYPRLTGVINDRDACNRVINEQTEMGVLIALPGVLATLVLAPWILRLVYSTAFVGATEVIRWQILADAWKVVCWPLGYIALAKGRGGLFIAFEGSFAALQVVLYYLCIRWWHFEGAGIAVFLECVLYTPCVLFLARCLTGFSWTRHCRGTLAWVVGMTTLVFVLCRYLDSAIALTAGLALSLISALWSLRKLNQLLGKDFFTKFCRRVLDRFKKTGDSSAG